MTRHVIRLIWNRKRQNALLLVELFCAFLVLVAVVVAGAHVTVNARQPLGFDGDRVWMVTVNRAAGAFEDGLGGDSTGRDRDVFRQVLNALADMSEVEAASGAFTAPYRNASWENEQGLEDGRRYRFGANRVDDRFAEVLGIHLVAGRWFSREDDGASWTPAVINARLARELFGTEDAIGRTIRDQESPGPSLLPVQPEKRVVGVVDDFRQFGELSTPGNYVFYRSTLDDPADRLVLPDVVLLRLAAGTTAAFEEPLVRRLEAAAPGWSFDVSALADLRDDMFRQFAVPLAGFAIVAAFLLLMVALGLTGVVWQGVVQRTREFGLRRAAGATGVAIGRQVLAELAVMTTLAVGAGCLVLAQLPVLPLPAEIAVVPPSAFVTRVAISVATIYGVTMLCGWYPSRMATRIPSAQALHYE